MRSGWPIGRMVTLWGSVVIACGVAAALGFLLASDLPDVVGARAAAIAAGGLLAMLAASLVPFAYEKGGPWAALATVVGFCASMSQT
jgi:ZIP family zinc transporter